MGGKGAAAERELSNLLEDEFRYASLPAGGSGSGTERARPDVLACRRPTLAAPGGSASILAIECKAWSDGCGQLDAAEIDALRSFATRAGGRAVVAVRPDLRRFDRWHCYYISDLADTSAGNHSIRQAERPGRPLSDIVTAPTHSNR